MNRRDSCVHCAPNQHRLERVEKYPTDYTPERRLLGAQWSLEWRGYPSEYGQLEPLSVSQCFSIFLAFPQVCISA